MYKITGLWELWQTRYRFTSPSWRHQSLGLNKGTIEQGDNGASVCPGTWVSTAGLAAAKQQHQQRGQGTHLDPTQAEGAQGGQCLRDPALAGEPRLGAAPAHWAFICHPVFGERHGVHGTGRILHQSFYPGCQSGTTMQYGLNRPKASPRMDYSQFSCSSPSCCNLSLKNTCALFVLEGLFVPAFADRKYPISN